jgi:hypothetical protein
MKCVEMLVIKPSKIDAPAARWSASAGPPLTAGAEQVGQIAR